MVVFFAVLAAEDLLVERGGVRGAMWFESGGVAGSGCSPNRFAAMVKTFMG